MHYLRLYSDLRFPISPVSAALREIDSALRIPHSALPAGLFFLAALFLGLGSLVLGDLALGGNGVGVAALFQPGEEGIA